MRGARGTVQSLTFEAAGSRSAGKADILSRMKVDRLAFALLALSAIGVSRPIHAQCLECAQQMFQATLTTHAWYNINQDQIDQTRSRDARNGVCYDANRSAKECRGKATVSRPTDIAPTAARQAENAVLAVLDAEYRRRVQAGDGSAGQWLNRAAGDTGRQVGALNAEYRRRRSTDGAASADRWYVESASRIAARYVGSNRNAGTEEAAADGVPAATRQRAEDATLAVFDPEINRRSSRDGKAATIEWAQSAGRAVGAGVRSLAPEYLLRAKADGQASADAWYIDQARSLAGRQIRSQP